MNSEALPSGESVVTRVWQIVQSPELRRDDFLTDQEAGDPEPTTDELKPLWRGRPVFATSAQARRKARGLRGLGAYIAAIDLSLSDTLRIERTLRSKGHHTLFGDTDEVLRVERATGIVLPIN